MADGGQYIALSGITITDVFISLVLFRFIQQCSQGNGFRGQNPKAKLFQKQHGIGDGDL